MKGKNAYASDGMSESKVHDLDEDFACGREDRNQD